jgi:hypothetical protein
LRLHCRVHPPAVAPLLILRLKSEGIQGGSVDLKYENSRARLSRADAAGRLHDTHREGAYHPLDESFRIIRKNFGFQQFPAFCEIYRTSMTTEKSNHAFVTKQSLNLINTIDIALGRFTVSSR